jgi:hypothetical protein
LKQSEVINIDGIGKINIRRSYKARRLNITVKPREGVIVSVPVGMSYSCAASLVNEKKEWILSALKKIKVVEKSKESFKVNSGFVTRSHKLEYRSGKFTDISVRIGDGKIKVYYPESLRIDSREVQFMARKGIVEALRIEAKNYLPERVETLSKIHGFGYNKLTVKNIKSRWGSCSKSNNINLSIHLMTLPDHLIDYVILHELVHTKIKNHGSGFWLQLHKITGNAKVLDKELKKCSININ